MYSTQATVSPPETASRIRLRFPELANSLCDTDIIGLKRVQRNAKENGSSTERPHGRVADHGYALLGEVVDDARLETNVRVDDEQGAEDRVGDGVQRASGEGCDCEGDETSGNDPRTLSALLAVSMFRFSRLSM